MPVPRVPNAGTGVVAVVLTYDAPDAARECVAAVRAQTRPPDAVLVVDNAGPRPFATDDPGVTVERLPENTGPAGGYAAGLRAFLASDGRFAWLLDDDARPRADALAGQLAALADAAGPEAALATMVDRDSGAPADTFGWCGVLIPREIVEAVGTPIAELFWWSEDTEYLQWRIPRAGFATRRVDGAVVEVGRRPADGPKPAWKYYYEARNQVYYRVHVQRQPESGPREPFLTVRVRWGRAARAVARLLGRALWREPVGRTEKAGMVLRGAADGLRRRLGRTVVPDGADRPPEPAAGSGRVQPEEPLDLGEA